MKIRISLSKAVQNLPPLNTFLSKQNVDFLRKWVAGSDGIHASLEKKGLPPFEYFQSIQQELKSAGLWNPVSDQDLYRGLHLNGEDFIRMIRSGKLEPRSAVASWTTQSSVALLYLKGIQSKKRLPFGILFHAPAGSLETVVDLRQIEKQIDPDVAANAEVIVKDSALKSTFIASISIPLNDKKAQKEAFKALEILYKENLMLDKPDSEGFMYRVDTKGRVHE